MRWLRPVLWGVAAFAAIYVALDLNKLYALRYGTDLGIFLQTIANLAHGSSWNFGEWRPHFQVHDSWVLFAAVPPVALIPRAETLIVFQVLLLALAAIPLALFAREAGLSAANANLLAIAYLLSPATQGIAYDNFSENDFVPALAFTLALAVRRRAFWPALIGAQLLMGVKEDEILFVAWFAAACAIFWDRRLGVAALALAAVNGAAYWGVEHLLHAVPAAPHYGLAIGDSGGKLTLAVMLLVPFAFAPLAAGCRLLLGLPVVAEIVFAQNAAYEPSRLGSHYTAPLLALTAIAAALGARHIPALGRAMVPCALVAMLLIFNDTVLRPGRWPYLVDWSAYASAQRTRETMVPVLLGRHDEGIWAIAAVNPLVRLSQRPDPRFVACPDYNRNARAFFESLGIGTRERWKLCGGVPVGAVQR